MDYDWLNFRSTDGTTEKSTYLVIKEASLNCLHTCFWLEEQLDHSYFTSQPQGPGGGGGALGYLLGGYVPPGTPNWHPVLKKTPKSDAPFKKWANFCIPRSRIRPKTDTPFWKWSCLSKMAESALAARAKIRPPCTLKHRVQQEYNSLLVNALNRINFE